MPFDGVVAKCVVKELQDLLPGGRIEKIFQPEADEIIMNIRAKGQNLKLLLSSCASYPRIHVTEGSRENPAAPPMFCMLLRKHLSGGKILDVEFHHFERIVSLHVEAINELGDISVKRLIIEIMGRHSNIILVNAEDRIIDAIKHVDAEISSVREVMPARPYMLPPSQDKANPEQLDISHFIDMSINRPDVSMENYLLSGILGFSPVLCREFCYRAAIDGRLPASEATPDQRRQLKEELQLLLSRISQDSYSPCIIYTDGDFRQPLDFHCIEMRQYPHINYLPSISKVLDHFYSTKDRLDRLKQKKADLQKVMKNNLDRCKKKLALQQEKLRDVADRSKLQLYGELITANIYCIPAGAKSVSLMNYYSESYENLDVPMDENLTPQENAQRYFKQYTKAKSTFTYTNRQVEESLRELEYLESVQHLLDTCLSIQDIEEVRQELGEQGYVHARKSGTSRKQAKASVPLRFTSCDGLEILVGRNNRQNDQLTLKTASSNDIWLHTQKIPGSHVIIRKGQQDIPDTTLLEAATLAAYHSKAKQSSTVPVDFTTVRNVKKPGGAKPGMVIYENYKTIIVTPDETVVQKLKTE
jgi:predicted ribosome quality control (RQC) complex YloA/Tae2 family protein